MGFSFFDIAIMVNNYSHDIATAMLAVSAVSLLILSKNYPASGSRELELYFIRANRAVAKMAGYSLIWVLLAGVPRVIFYKRYEWSSAAGGNQVVAIVLKHIIMFLLVGMGVFYWLKIHQRVRGLRLKHMERG